MSRMRWSALALGAVMGVGLTGPFAAAQDGETAMDLEAMMSAARGGGGGGGDDDKPDFPDFDDVAKGYTKVGASDGSLYTLWMRKKDGQMLAELPRGYSNQKHYFATSVPTGEMFAGLQSTTHYASWKRYDKRVALIEPQLDVRSTGDAESQASIKNHFVDSVVVDVPILCMGPGGQPVIDLDDLLLGRASSLGYSSSGMNRGLTEIAKAKAFPQNIEVAFTVPVRGDLKTFHYSISNVKKSPGYKPRHADERVGYFMTTWRDLGKFSDADVPVRYINRWHLEKADPKLELSPPKTPLTYYIEHTVPIRYRRWVKRGVEYWNKAYEAIGLSEAIVVHYQDKTTGAHMDKDPEDVRYNFIRWLSNDIGTAIGPSRAHPETGEILDADIVLTDGWIRAFWYYSNDFLPDLASEGFSAETLAWLDTKPQWDPRVRLAHPSQRERLMAENIQKVALRGAGPDFDRYGEAAYSQNKELRQLVDAVGHDTALCLAAAGKAREMSSMGLHFALLGLLDGHGGDHDNDAGKKDCADCADGETCEACTLQAKKKAMPKIDGIPEFFLGPMLADLVAHEVGHTLGLRHNFKASSLYSMAEINSEAMKGKAFAGSVMDYIPVNYNMDDGECQGEYAMVDLGPYDFWAIEFGYGFGDPEEVLSRVAEPELAYSTDYDTAGPDPLARRYDFAKDPLAYSKSRMRLANFQRERILEDFVKDGEHWGRARRGYEITLGGHVGAIGVMSNWLGGAFVHNDHKGDPNGRTPLVPVPAADQRAALDFVIENAFFDEAFGLTPELLQHMTISKHGGDWTDYDDSTWPIHDRIAGIQSSAMTQIMNPTTLRRIYDNELLVPADEDALTLPEVMEKVAGAVWAELESAPSGSHTERSPMISSLRRELQAEHIERLIDLSMGGGYGAAAKPIAQLASAQLRNLQGHIDSALESDGKMDAYTSAHLHDASRHIAAALDAGYSINGGSSGGGVPFFLFGEAPSQDD